MAPGGRNKFITWSAGPSPLAWYLSSRVFLLIQPTMTRFPALLVGASIQLLHANLVSAASFWRGLQNLDFLFVFGDSYSTVGFRSTSTIPTTENPIGITYPGTTITHGENWVGALTTKFNKTLTLTWDYAISGGQIVTSMQKQVEEQFLETAGLHPDFCPWASNNSLFASWIGINDINRSVVSERLPLEFTLQDEMYKVGARNFLFLNVPPFDKSPGGNFSIEVRDQITLWNNLLPALVTNFTCTHPDSTAFLFDTQALWQEFYDNPAAFNITDVNAVGGGLWYDAFHPSTQIQTVIGQRVARFIDTVA
ncbi:Gdsl-like lipase/acylhydrolase family protein [Mycena kentingensis (nom. inval.)]|nr:Gdsl-like lipase/acylhydrolase family protein [Mycena kentingensis (nom. inval.)]